MSHWLIRSTNAVLVRGGRRKRSCLDRRRIGDPSEKTGEFAGAPFGILMSSCGLWASSSSRQLPACSLIALTHMVWKGPKRNIPPTVRFGPSNYGSKCTRKLNLDQMFLAYRSIFFFLIEFFKKNWYPKRAELTRSRYLFDKVRDFDRSITKFSVSFCSNNSVIMENSSVSLITGEDGPHHLQLPTTSHSFLCPSSALLHPSSESSLHIHHYPPDKYDKGQEDAKAVGKKRPFRWNTCEADSLMAVLLNLTTILFKSPLMTSLPTLIWSWIQKTARSKSLSKFHQSKNCRE